VDNFKKQSEKNKKLLDRATLKFLRKRKEFEDIQKKVMNFDEIKKKMDEENKTLKEKIKDISEENENLKKEIFRLKERYEEKEKSLLASQKVKTQKPKLTKKFKCSECGAIVSEKDTVCPKCGAKFE